MSSGKTLKTRPSLTVRARNRRGVLMELQFNFHRGTWKLLVFEKLLTSMLSSRSWKKNTKCPVRVHTIWMANFDRLRNSEITVRSSQRFSLESSLIWTMFAGVNRASRKEPRIRRCVPSRDHEQRTGTLVRTSRIGKIKMTSACKNVVRW